MSSPVAPSSKNRLDLANRLFFRLYQCANMMHKTGSSALEKHGLTTQQWAVLGALSRPSVAKGMSVGDLARYLMVSRQNLAGVLGRMHRDGHLREARDAKDRRVRLISMSASGRRVWTKRALPEIHAYYQRALSGFSEDDLSHTLHCLQDLLDNLKELDESRAARIDRAPGVGALARP